VALADALLQEDVSHVHWHTRLIAPLQAMRAAQTAQHAGQTQSTRVEFFTVARETGSERGEEDPAWTALGLQDMAPGFADITANSQAVFRCALDAIAHPGTAHAAFGCPPAGAAALRQPGGCQRVVGAAGSGLHPAGSRKRLRTGPVASWLRFHTGCRITADCAAADFVWAASFAELPALAGLKHGSAEYPDQSATCVVDVAAWEMQSQRSQAGALAAPGAAPASPGAVTLRVDRLVRD
jgi:alpha-D-ribose 1-methylphosphonate 5-triphosphate synthase subunit PhnH